MTRQEQYAEAAKYCEQFRKQASPETAEWFFIKGAEWADSNPCEHSWEPNTTMTMMRCEWCGLEADRISENKRLKAQLAVAVEALDFIDQHKMDLKGKDPTKEGLWIDRMLRINKARYAIGKINSMKGETCP